MHTAITSEHLGHWTAWLEGHPEVGFGGETPAEALRRLCETLPGFDVNSIVADHSRTRDGRLAFAIGDECPDCGGSGRYANLRSRLFGNDAL